MAGLRFVDDESAFIIKPPHVVNMIVLSSFMVSWNLASVKAVWYNVLAYGQK